MVDKFEVGKKYRFTGTSRPCEFNSGGEMDFWLDGEPRECLFAEQNGVYVRFDNQTTPGVWNYGATKRLFELVHDRLFELLDRDWETNRT